MKGDYCFERFPAVESFDSSVDFLAAYREFRTRERADDTDTIV